MVIMIPIPSVEYLMLDTRYREVDHFVLAL